MNHPEIINSIEDTLIHSYQVIKNLEYSTRKYKGEIDLLAIDVDGKEAIVVEVKTHDKPKAYAKAVQQLTRHNNYMRSMGLKLYKIYKVYYSNEKQEMIL